METIQPYKIGKLLGRRKRFLADIEFSDGERIVAHNANTGSMESCLGENYKAFCSFHDNPKRKLKWSLDFIYNGQSWIGVHTHRANDLAHEAIAAGVIEELAGYHHIHREVAYGDSRIDFKLESELLPDCYVEVKNVTLKGPDDFAMFPDSPSVRGQKHLRELIQIVQNKQRAVMLFIVQREDCHSFTPAYLHDPDYAQLLREAYQAGVEILVYACALTPPKVWVEKALPWFFLEEDGHFALP